MDYPLMKTVFKSRTNKKAFEILSIHQYKLNFEKWVFTDETSFWLKNAGEKRWIMKWEDYIQSTTKT